MEEVNLMDLLSYYLKKIPMILIITALAAVLGIIYTVSIQVPLYHGTTSIVLVQKNSETSNITQNEITVSEKLVSTYSEIIKSDRVLSQVISSLKLDLTVSELADKITVSSLNDTAIIKITVSDKSNIQAVSIANEIADVFSGEIAKIYNLENIFVLDIAQVEDSPYNVNVVSQISLATIAGLVVSCIIVFIMFYFDNTIKNKKEIETKLKLPVLGETPIADKENLESSHNHKKTSKELEFEMIDQVLEENNVKSQLKKNSKMKGE